MLSRGSADEATGGVIYAAAQSASKALISANSTTSGGQFFAPLQASGTTTSIVLAARYDATNALVVTPTLKAGLDSTRRVLTSFQAGGNQLAGLRNAASRPAGGGTKAAGNYTTTTPGTTAPPFTDTRSGLGGNSGATPANFYAGRIYSGYAINRVLTDAEIRNADEWIAARMTITLP